MPQKPSRISRAKAAAPAASGPQPVQTYTPPTNPILVGVVTGKPGVGITYTGQPTTNPSVISVGAGVVAKPGPQLVYQGQPGNPSIVNVGILPPGAGGLQFVYNGSSVPYGSPGAPKKPSKMKDDPLRYGEGDATSRKA